MLMQETSQEQYYISHPDRLSDTYKKIETIDYHGQKVYIFRLPLLNQQVVQIRKDSRFTNVPKYIHTNINLNYVYSGKCTYIVDNHKLVLSAGDVCLFDTNVVRSKESLGRDDIIINISLSHEFFSHDFIVSLQSEGIVYRWLLAALASITNDHDNFILFRTNHNKKITQLFQYVLEEYYGYTPFSVETINAYMHIIFVELVRAYNENKSGQLLRLNQKIIPEEFLRILRFVEKNADNYTLSEVADRFGYSTRYLASIIHKTSGESFSELKKTLRLTKAANLLITTDKNIDEICETVGIKNRSFFFKEFEKRYQHSPAKYRAVYR